MRSFVIGIVCICLSACQALPLMPFKINTYTDSAPVLLNVSLMEVQSDTQTYNRLPHIEKQMPITPDDAVQDWAHNRLRATNPTSPITAEFQIKKAYMTQSDAPSGKWYILDNVAYRLDYDVVLYFKQNGQIIHSQTAGGWEEYAIPQKSSLISKENIWEKMMNNMIQKINDKIIPQIPSKFIQN